MAFTLSKQPRHRYSFSELALFSNLRQSPRDTNDLTRLFYGGKPPINGRVIVGGLLRSLADKIKRNREDFRLIKSQRRGPYPVEYHLESRR